MRGDADTGMESHQNTQPHIIAYGVSKGNITHYTISVDNEYMSVSVNSGNSSNLK